MSKKHALLGPGANYDDDFYLDYIEQLRNEAIRAKLAAAGAEMAWKNAIDCYAVTAANRLGYKKGKAYELNIPAETLRLLRLTSNLFFFSHAEGCVYGLPGLYFHPVKQDGAPQKRALRMLTLNGGAL